MSNRIRRAPGVFLRCPMASFLHAIASVVIILILTAVGYFCAAQRWMGPEVKAFLSRFLIRLAVPCMCVYSLRSNLTRAILDRSGPVLLVPFFTSALLFLLSFGIGRLFAIPRRRLGVFMFMCSVSNAVFVGFPMCSELFGEAATPYVMLYYLVNTSFTQIVGLSLVRWSGDKGARHSWREVLVRFIKTPPVIGVFIGFGLILLDVQLPSFLMSCLRYINGTVTPLALLLTGYIIHEIGLSHLRIDRDTGVMLLFRFLLSPALSVLLGGLLGVGGLAGNVLAVESAMPVVTQSVVASAEYGADEQFAAQGAAISTLACFIVIPVLMLLLSL